MNTQKRPKGFEHVFFADGKQIALTHPINKDLSNLKIALRQLHHNTDLLVDAFTQRCERENVQVDCHMGCQWCCHQAVFASTYEIIVLNDYLERRFSKDVIQGVKERALKKDKNLNKLSASAALKTSYPCPLLRKGSCMAYPVRPMACRIYLSSNEKSCQRKYDNPKDSENAPTLFDFPLIAGRQLNEGFASDLRCQGLIIEEHRIEHILLILMESPDKKNEWLHGATIHDSFPFEEACDLTVDR
jgi:Fe-S-cluster containining protein